MKYLRPAACALLILYSLLTLGAFFHSHGDSQHVSVHCKICDFSSTLASEPNQISSGMAMADLGMVGLEEQQRLPYDLQSVSAGRAPPRS